MHFEAGISEWGEQHSKARRLQNTKRVCVAKAEGLVIPTASATNWRIGGRITTDPLAPHEFGFYLLLPTGVLRFVLFSDRFGGMQSLGKSTVRHSSQVEYHPLSGRDVYTAVACCNFRTTPSPRNYPGDCQQTLSLKNIPIVGFRCRAVIFRLQRVCFLRVHISCDFIGHPTPYSLTEYILRHVY